MYFTKFKIVLILTCAQKLFLFSSVQLGDLLLLKEQLTLIFITVSSASPLFVFSQLYSVLSCFQVTPEGTFLDVRTIGRFCYEDDLLTLSAVYTEAQAESQPGFPRLYTDKTINSLKHRLLVYLWRRAEQDGSATAKRRYTNLLQCFSLIFFYYYYYYYCSPTFS